MCLRRNVNSRGVNSSTTDYYSRHRSLCVIVIDNLVVITVANVDQFVLVVQQFGVGLVIERSLQFDSWPGRYQVN